MQGFLKCVFALFLVLSLAMPAWGQDNDLDQDPPSYEEAGPDDEGAFQDEETFNDDADAYGEEEMGILIKKIVFEGNRVIDTQTLQELTAPYRDKEMSLREMGELTDLITMTYQEKGYILARAYLPEQEIGKGVLKIAIAEGNVGKVKVVGEKYYSPDVLKRYFKTQERHGVIKEDLLEEAIVLSTKLPDVTTGIYLKEGEKTGETDLIIEPKETPSLTLGVKLSADYNNYGTVTTGKDRFGTTLSLVEHKWGSRINLRAISGVDNSESRMYSADYALPFLYWGTELGVSFFKGNTFNELYGLFTTDSISTQASDIETANIYLLQPILKKRATTLNVVIGAQHKKFKLFTEDPNENVQDIVDDRRTFYSRLNFENTDRFLGRNFFNFEHSIGVMEPAVKNAAGAYTVTHTRYNQTTGESIVDTAFQKFQFQIGRIQKVYGYTNLLVRAVGQLSGNRLPQTEQFGIGGYWTVRGQPNSSAVGDSGYSLTAELMFAPPFVSDEMFMGQRLGQLAQFICFIDHGGTYLTDPNENDGTTGKSENLTGYGAGFRLFYKKSFVFKYTLGIPEERQAGERDMYHYFEGSYQFF